MNKQKVGEAQHYKTYQMRYERCEHSNEFTRTVQNANAGSPHFGRKHFSSYDVNPRKSSTYYGFANCYEHKNNNRFLCKIFKII